MRKYRIEIRTLNNGEVQYSPQVGFPVWFGLYVKWFNIVTYKNKIWKPEYSETSSIWYDTEGEALASMEEYKAHIFEIDGKKTKSTTYKNYE